MVLGVHGATFGGNPLALAAAAAAAFDAISAPDMKLATNSGQVMAAARERRLLVAGGGDNYIRLLPPLVISREEADEAVARLGNALADVTAAARKEAT